MTPKPMTNEPKPQTPLTDAVPRPSDIPTHPLAQPWRATKPRGCHPKIAAIPNWQKKVCLPWPRAARLRRKMLARGIKLGLPRPLTNLSAAWSEWEAVLNGAMSNMATPAASTYGLPIYNPASGFPAANPERNEFWDDSTLLKFLCCEGKAHSQWPNH